MWWQVGRVLIVCVVLVAGGQTASDAAELLVSLGVRETGSDSGVLGSNGGSVGDIEWIGRGPDVEELVLPDDGEWHRFEFYPLEDPILGFTGNHVIDGDYGTLEHIRFTNTEDGTTAYRIWIDDVRSLDIDDTDVQITGFENATTGPEYMFRGPGFSGSSAPHVDATSEYLGAAVTEDVAFEGAKSLQVEVEFVDDTPPRWLRLTTFNARGLPNPVVYIGPGSLISFQAKLEAISLAPNCDLNGDGSVDAADAGIMFGDWGERPGSIADKNGDGLVDAADAGVMFAQWTGDAAVAAVPEPALAAWWVLALGGYVSTQRRREPIQ